MQAIRSKIKIVSQKKETNWSMEDISPREGEGRNWIKTRSDFLLKDRKRKTASGKAHLIW